MKTEKRKKGSVTVKMMAGTGAKRVDLFVASQHST
jgi:ATP-dependent Zn protease